MGNALKNLFADQANAIREGLGDIGKIAPADFPAKTREIVALIGGGSYEDVRYVTFMNHNGTKEEGVKPTAVGDDCADPITRGLFDAPEKESTAQYHFPFVGWATEPDGALDENALKAVNEDRTLYAAHGSLLREYTITYMDGDTVLKTEVLSYGAMPSYAPSKTGALFGGWVPELTSVTGNATYTAVWNELPTFATATWGEIASVSASGNASGTYTLGDRRTITIGSNDVEVEIAGFDHDDLADGSGKAGISIIARTTIVPPVLFHDNTYPTSNTWANSAIRQWLVNDFWNNLPDELKAVIKEVSKKSCTTYNGALETLSEKVWMPSAEEMNTVPYTVGGTSMSNFINRGQGNKYALFTEDSKCIRYDGGTAVKVGTRSRSAQFSQNYWSVNTAGALTPYFNACNPDNPSKIIFGFCI